MPGSGNARIDVGTITQSTTKGKGLESTLASALNKTKPGSAEAPKGSKKQKGKK